MKRVFRYKTCVWVCACVCVRTEENLQKSIPPFVLVLVRQFISEAIVRMFIYFTMIEGYGTLSKISVVLLVDIYVVLLWRETGQNAPIRPGDHIQSHLPTPGIKLVPY